MNKIITIAKKEFLDTFRDKRTLVRMVMIPLLAFPLILYVITTLQSALSEKEAAKVLEIGYVNWENELGDELISNMSKDTLYDFIEYSDTASLRLDVESDTINLGLFFDEYFDQSYKADTAAHYHLYMRAADYEEKERFDILIQAESSRLLNERLATVDKGPEFSTPLKERLDNRSNQQEVIGKYAGGILPYIFIAFLFMGCMLPAIDLFAGEKERGTIETLLTSPVNRLQILLGKMVVIVAMGLISAIVALVGLYAAIQLMDIPAEIMSIVNDILSLQLITTLLLLLLPLAIFFAGVMIPVSVYARSFKEAQSILTPLNIVMVLPAMVGFIPGIELTFTTAFIPIVNVVLATKSIVAGTPDFLLIAITFFTLVALSAVAVAISIKQFGSESNVLRR
ncbi:MAG: ABC transporter permease subunit [Crocinitomicaceae bacterium]|nr:ABC transporter permease subunit [Crocinitomicaceae bacterium]